MPSPPRPKTAAPLLPKQRDLISDIWEHLKQSNACAQDFKNRAPAAKKELEEIAKADAKNTKAALLAKMAQGLVTESPRVQSATQAFFKQVEKVIAIKITYVAFKAEAKKIEHAYRGLEVYAEKYHETFKANDFKPKKMFSKVTDAHCKTWIDRLRVLEKLIDKL